MNLADFVVQHQNDDISDLVLHRDRYPDVDVALAAECIAARRKLRYKVPEWYADPALVCPVALSAEQCSSTSTARYKAAVAEGVCRLPLNAIREEQRARPCPVKGPRSGHCSSASLQPALPTSLRIADLTGGLGVDCWQFSLIADRVLYNEMNPLLLEAARANLLRLGCRNVEFSGLCITPESLPSLLDSFRPDLVFADPARRSEGRKVFLPEDCSPDVLALQDIVLSRGCRMMLKLSPMADISLMLNKFHCVKSVYVVEAEGECKELLLLMVPGFDGEADVVVACHASDTVPVFNDSLRFRRSEEKAAVPKYISEAPVPGQILFEPGPALSKSGAFNLLSARFGLRKLGPSTHLYCIDTFDSVTADSVTAHKAGAMKELAGYGKCFEIQEVATFGKQSLRDFASHWPGAEVTARALPLSSDELRLKMASPGKKAPRSSDSHLFGVGTSIGRLLLAAHKIRL